MHHFVGSSNVRLMSFRPIDLKVGSGDPQGSLGEIKGVLPGNLTDLFVSVSQSVQMGPNAYINWVYPIGVT